MNNLADAPATTSLPTAEVSPGQRRPALWAAGLFTLLTVVLLPFASMVHTPVPGFVPIYQTGVILAYALTAYLLFGHFRECRVVSLLWVGGGALFTAIILFLQLLSFPNVLAAGRLFGTGPNTTTWLWTFWHLGPPLYAIGFALAERHGPGRRCAENQVGLMVLWVTAAVVATVAVTGLVVTTWVDALPTIVRGDDYTGLIHTGIGPAVEILTVAALVLLWRCTGLATVLQLWLAVSLFTLILDNGLTLAGGGRGTIGWTFGRLEALISASLILMVYLRELGVLHRHVAEDAQRLAAQAATLEETARMLAAARAEAEAASEAKSQFLAGMSHELRTPLTSIIGFADLLLREELPANERQRFLALQRNSGRMLLALVNDILDFSKIEAGRIELERLPVDLRGLAAECLSVVEEAARDKNLALQSWIDDQVPAWVAADPTRLRQILLNLLSNAVKFTASGQVELSIGPMREPGRIRFTVKDTGIGIPAEARGRLFERFRQVDGSTTRRYGGTGLGLAICRGLIERMGGTIGVESVHGSGSSFWFELDLELAAAPAVILPAGHAKPARALHILLAEDVTTNQILVATLLEMEGHTVEICSDGAEAVAAVRARPFDLVLMDVQMPVMDGLEATRRIRHEFAPSALPILALTADVSPGTIARCYEAGMTGHLTKPVDGALIFEAIEQACSPQNAPPVATRQPNLRIIGGREG